MKLNLSKLILLSAFAANFVTPEVRSADNNWPQFRGPKSLGVSESRNLPVTWSATQHVVWAAPVPGYGWSSPIVWGDKIFVTSVVKDGEVETPKKGLYFCLSEDGDTFVVPAGPQYRLAGRNSLGEMCMATPAIAQDSLIIRTASKLYRIRDEKAAQ